MTILKSLIWALPQKIVRPTLACVISKRVSDVILQQNSALLGVLHKSLD